MKLYCRGEYHNSPHALHYSGPGVIEVDEAKALFLLADAPGNFTRDLAEAKAAPVTPLEAEASKAFDEPSADKALKGPVKKK